MFDAVAPWYDALNALLSGGLDARWRRAAAGALALPPGSLVLDLGTGSGRLAESLAARYPVVGLDVSRAMLALAVQRATRAGPGRPRHVRGSAFRLPFRDRAFAGAASGFLLRNLDDLPAAFAELARVLVPGGRVALVDITEPRGPLRRRLFHAYFGRAAPLAGRLSGNSRAYEYLARSLEQLPPPGRVTGLLAAVGLRGRARPLFPGMVTLWTATRA